MICNNGIVGLGAGAPIDFVTGETIHDSMSALQSDYVDRLVGQSIYSLPAHCQYLANHLSKTPAARCALEIALFDAFAKLAQKPLVDILGRQHQSLPTSVTIGIKPIEEALLEAKEYVQQGFKVLKVKLGENSEQDIELVTKINELLPEVTIRVDMNQGYTLEDFLSFNEQTKEINIELIEQPFNRQDIKAMISCTPSFLNKVAVDESLCSPSDALYLIKQKQNPGIFNIKLMKCGVFPLP